MCQQAIAVYACGHTEFAQFISCDSPRRPLCVTGPNIPCADTDPCSICNITNSSEGITANLGAQSLAPQSVPVPVQPTRACNHQILGRPAMAVPDPQQHICSPPPVYSCAAAPQCVAYSAYRSQQPQQPIPYAHYEPQSYAPCLFPASAYPLSPLPFSTLLQLHPIQPQTLQVHYMQGDYHYPPPPYKYLRFPIYPPQQLQELSQIHPAFNPQHQQPPLNHQFQTPGVQVPPTSNNIIESLWGATPDPDSPATAAPSQVEEEREGLAEPHPAPPPADNLTIPPNAIAERRQELINGYWHEIVHYHFPNIGVKADAESLRTGGDGGGDGGNANNVVQPRIGRQGVNTYMGIDNGPLPPGWDEVLGDPSVVVVSAAATSTSPTQGQSHVEYPNPPRGFDVEAQAQPNTQAQDMAPEIQENNATNQIMERLPPEEQEEFNTHLAAEPNAAEEQKRLYMYAQTQTKLQAQANISDDDADIQAATNGSAAAADETVWRGAVNIIQQIQERMPAARGMRGVAEMGMEMGEDMAAVGQFIAIQQSREEEQDAMLIAEAATIAEAVEGVERAENVAMVRQFEAAEAAARRLERLGGLDPLAWGGGGDGAIVVQGGADST